MKDIIIKEIKKYAKYIIIVVAFIFINMYVLTIPSKIIGQIIDKLVKIEENKEVIIRLTINLIGVSILYLIVRLPWRTLATYTSTCFEKDLKDKIFSQFMKIRMTDLQNIKNGELMSYLTKDVTEIRSFFFRIMTYGVRILAIGVITIPTMVISANFKLTIVTLSPIIITIYLVIKVKGYVEKSFKKSQKY